MVEWIKFYYKKSHFEVFLKLWKCIDCINAVPFVMILYGKSLEPQDIAIPTVATTPKWPSSSLSSSGHGFQSLCQAKLSAIDLFSKLKKHISRVRLRDHWPCFSCVYIIYALLYILFSFFYDLKSLVVLFSIWDNSDSNISDLFFKC